MTALAKLDANDQKQELRIKADCRCIVCGAPLPYDLFDLGHRVLKSRSMLEIYGREVIYHPLNMLPVCHGTKAGKSCNDQCNIAGQRMQARELLDRIIRITTGRETMPDMRGFYADLRAEFEERRKQ